MSAEHAEAGSGRAPGATVTVVVPTFRRPDPLRRSLESLMAQRLDVDAQVEIVVVDNSPDGEAREIVEPYVRDGAYRVRYVSEPRPGVSNARNRGVREAAGAYIAFLDDDEEASPEWLASHLRTLRATGAAACFGPVDVAAESDRDVTAFARYFDRAIAREEGADITDRAAHLGTNNSMFDAAACFSGGDPFAPELNSVGGEDSLLLQQLTRGGRRLAWSAQARVVEWVPDRRLTWDYVRRRKFLSGQIRCFVLDMLRPRPLPEIATWMTAGLIQTVLFGGLSLALRPVDASRSRRFWVAAWGGLGKMFWMRRFRISLYGTQLVS
ncbi:MAG: glycosyltransferase [Caulobacterales bacterium]|nr:glycosyltransferase [Caulobacterales bacterium]